MLTTRRRPSTRPSLARTKLTFVGLSRELAVCWRLSDGWASFTRFMLHGLGYRVQRLVHVGGRRRHEVGFKDGTRLSYRVNRGDIRVIAEVWLAGAYELPFAIAPRNVIDMGSNIGAAAVWLSRRYGASRLVAVEPVPANADLARVNLARTGVDFEVLTAAVGPVAGTARFEVSETSTLGRIGEQGLEVELVTPQALVDRFPREETIDLVKIDIEGGEQAVFAAELDWLDRVECLVIELHTDRVDEQRIIERLQRRGFTPHAIAHDNLYRGPYDVMIAFQR
jgi:FkbM family methyltransferase